MAVTKNEVAEMKNEQEKLEDFLKSELMKEGDEILAEIEADESLKDISLPEEMDEGLWKKIQKKQAEKAAYEALSEKDKEALRLGREMMMLNGDDVGTGEGKYEKTEVGECDAESAVENDGAKVVKYSRKRRKRVYLLVAAVAILALAAGMTSIGGAPFVAKIRKQLIGEREMVKVNSEREGEDDRVTSSGEEEKAWQGIKEELGIEPVRMGYIPKGTKYVSSEIDTVLEEALVLFDYNGDIIEYRIFAAYKNKSVGYDIEDNLVNEDKLRVNGVEIKFTQYKVDQNLENIAQFEYKNSYYIINSTISEKEFLNVINNLNFF